MARNDEVAIMMECFAQVLRASTLASDDELLSMHAHPDINWPLEQRWVVLLK
jgi:hypothetical protein